MKKISLLLTGALLLSPIPTMGSALSAEAATAHQTIVQHNKPKPTLTTVKLKISQRGFKTHLSVTGNVTTTPAKAALRVRNADTKKVLAKCTVIVKCGITLPKSVRHVYATWGNHKTKTYVVPQGGYNAAACAETFNAKTCTDRAVAFKNFTLHAASDTITPPAYIGRKQTGWNWIFEREHTDKNVESFGAQVTTGTNLLTVTGVPANTVLQRDGLALYIFEVNDRDANIAAETDLNDGHLVYITDKNGNPTYNLFDWNGTRTHTYVAVVAPDNRTDGYQESTNHSQQPTFANFIKEMNSLPSVNIGVNYFISNPVSIKPQKNWTLVGDVGNDDLAEQLNPECECNFHTWAISNYTTYSNVAPAQLSAYNLQGIEDADLKLWDDHGGDTAANMTRYKKTIYGKALGVGYDAQENNFLSDHYPDLDGTWSYAVYRLNATTGNITEQEPWDNAEAYSDTVGVVYPGTNENLNSYQYFAARLANEGLIDIQAKTGRTQIHPARQSAYDAPTCNPDTDTHPIVNGKWNTTQMKYAIVDGLTDSALTKLYGAAGISAVDQCSAEYKITAAAMTAASFYVPGSKVSDLTKVAEAERFVFSNTDKYANLATKVADPATRAEALKEYAKEYAKDKAKEAGKNLIYDALNGYFKQHPPANGITPVFGDDPQG